MCDFNSPLYLGPSQAVQPCKDPGESCLRRFDDPGRCANGCMYWNRQPCKDTGESCLKRFEGTGVCSINGCVLSNRGPTPCHYELSTG
jgi:hypothetical protein